MTAAREPGAPDTLILLLDTNVILDYFLARSGRGRAVAELMDLAFESERVVLYVASLTLKDAYYLIARYLKREAAAQGKLTEGVAKAAQETAWACIRQLLDRVLVVSIGRDEALEACTLKRAHDDFEDDLLLAAAMKADATYLVTGDARLERHVPGTCIGVERALELARS